MILNSYVSLERWDVLPETQYKTYNSRLFAIVEILVKTWCYYLKRFKYEVFVLINYNNFRLFRLSLRQSELLTLCCTSP